MKKLILRTTVIIIVLIIVIITIYLLNYIYYPKYVANNIFSKIERYCYTKDNVNVDNLFLKNSVSSKNESVKIDVNKFINFYISYKKGYEIIKSRYSIWKTPLYDTRDIITGYISKSGENSKKEIFLFVFVKDDGKWKIYKIEKSPDNKI